MIFPFVPAPPTFDFAVDPHRGLTVTSGGVPLVRGSYFQVVSPDWSRAYFGSTSGTQTVDRVDPDTVRLSFKAPQVEGSQTYHREGDRLKVRYEFRYQGDGPAIVELAAGLVWTPALAKGATPAPAPSQSIGGRRLGPDSQTFGLAGPLGTLEGTASTPVTVFDARRYPQSWAEGKDVLWVGNLALPLTKGETKSFEMEWRVPGRAEKDVAPLKRTLEMKPVVDARLPDESRPIIIPKPTEDHLNYNSPIEITGAWSLPIGEFDHYADLKAALARRFIMPAVTAKTKRVTLDGGVSKLGLNPGGYRITIRGDRGVSVLGEEDTGLRNAVERLAQIAFIRNGKLYLPTGYLYNSPKVRWRGVHLFGGPKARAFHKTLWTKVLRPLGFDNVVLQCERTAWDATPGIATPISMSKAELGDLFGLYRNLGIEAIPLIQSFGHMEWLFANGKNLDLAMNPDVPYAVDPRKQRTKEVLSKIWTEAVALAQPKRIHFGLDEISMRGWTGGDLFLTDLWSQQLGFLSDVAKRLKVETMLWGDQALAQGEAPDAALAPNKEAAAKRRAAIPKYSWITDWHYLADPNPEKFTGVIQLWKDAGMRTVAATWYRPDNIRGFSLAAGLLGAGTLQTTWAGYESNESAMLENPQQFGAMVLSADYAWSGRKEKPSELPYDPNEMFRKMYYARPSPLKPVPGATVGTGASFEVGDIRFDGLDLRTTSVLRPNAEAGSAMELSVLGKGRELNLALATEVAADLDEPVAEVRVERVGAAPIVERLRYGRDVRALTDPAALSKGERSSGGPSCYRIDLGKPQTAISRITVRPLNSYSGIRLMGVTLVN
ncbi:hypothetical protein EON82_08615 [bacterium]|nr:MAG: hypothetical protein EON82_08615 [bacterium]